MHEHRHNRSLGNPALPADSLGGFRILIPRGAINKTLGANSPQIPSQSEAFGARRIGHLIR
jgi:hypothetical protein